MIKRLQLQRTLLFLLILLCVLTVVLADGLRVALVDKVTGSGGYVSADRRSLTRALGAEPAERAIRCAQYVGGSVALINNVEKG